MMNRIIIVIEILSLVVGLYNVFGEKAKLNFSFLSLILSLVAIQELMNAFRVNGIGTILVYIVMYVFSKKKFKETAVRTGGKLLLHLIFMTGLQFICLVAVNFLLSGYENMVVRAIFTNIIVLLCNIFIQVKMNIDEIIQLIMRTNSSFTITVGFITIVILMLLLTNKLKLGIPGETYFTPVLFTGFTVLWMIKWAISQTKLSEKEQEIERTQQGQEDFQELLMNIRLRQHEFKNHLLAILSTQYTYKTYEKLVRAQKEYLGRVKDDNKYYSLLLISNQQLAGFLYGKLQSIEKYGIAVECAVKTELNALSIPEYNMIEILGIFMDNAIEALERLEENRKFFLGIRERGEYYYFELRNVFPYIVYEERIRWFEKGVSHKGEGHGLGLYHAKQLCEKWGCDIQCDNLEIEEENWIQFNIRIKKVDNL